MDREIKEKCVKVHTSIWFDSSFWNFDDNNVALKNKIGLIDKRLAIWEDLQEGGKEKEIKHIQTYNEMEIVVAVGGSLLSSGKCFPNSHFCSI